MTKDSADSLIAIVGPESTGKTTLAIQLAQRLYGTWLPEYARDRLADTQYSEDDVHAVAHEQLARESDFVKAKPTIGILDTDAVVLRIWFAERFGHVPPYVDAHLNQQTRRLYLLTYPDLPWVHDPQRESEGNLKRLFEIYEATLQDLGCSYAIVRGKGDERMRCAIEALVKFNIICD